MAAPRTSSSRPCVLLTGFDAFGGETMNPSWLSVQSLHGRRIQDHTVVAAQLPTVFDDSLVELKRLLLLHKPALVICVGQAGGRAAISLERVAININDARIADNASAQPIDTPVINGGPAAYFSSLPIKAMLLAIRHKGIPAEVSQTAGTFVCNHVFYGLMHMLAKQRGFKQTRGGFIHVPYLPDQGQPSLPLDSMVQGLRIAVMTALKTGKDIASGAGALD
ncbi:MAG TPA: pyroglutamyl-peptidase I [Polaromonas sp.]|uniref:pyroglutamyl-peptidase I n=1 Tax=Polaromonas sp. TaxID=1869339 RepID=UPI002D745215|nr:pyroglutamyl-peptidase I [Polaromonas sp.]HYW58305.1 pyroglutamyl-peptidase I [Polaromonas sp.]